MKKSSKIFIERNRSMDKVPMCVMDVKEGRKEERKVTLKQGKEKKNVKIICLKNSLKGIEARRMFLIIYTPQCMTMLVILYTS